MSERIGNVLACEDIRREANGKLILIGVFPDNIIVGSFPTTLRVQYYVEYLPGSHGEQHLYFLLSKDTDKSEVQIQASIEVLGPTIVAAIDLPTITVTLKSETTLELSFSLDGETWESISRKRVVLGEVAGAVPIQRPEETT